MTQPTPDPRWYQLSAYNTETIYGHGYAEDADEYARVLNRSRETNHYTANPVDDAELVARLTADAEEGGSMGVDLETELMHGHIRTLLVLLPAPLARERLGECGNQDALVDVRVIGLAGEYEPEYEEQEAAYDRDMEWYGEIEVEVNGRATTVWCCIGVQPYMRATARAAGGGVRPYLTAWWTDGGDWCDLTHAESVAVLDAIIDSAPSLWHEVRG